MSRHPSVFLAVLASSALLFHSDAHAVDSVTVACDHSGISIMSGSTVEFHDKSRVTCNVDYTNNDPTDRSDVWVRVTWDVTTVNPVTTLLPDGVTGLSDPFTQLYSMVDDVIEEAGSPTPVFDGVAMTADFDLGTVPALSSSELFFDWLKVTPHPRGLTGLQVEVYENGAPGAGTLVVSNTYDVDFQDNTVFREVEAIGQVDAAHRYVGSAFGYPQAPEEAHTNLQMHVYLPYWNGSAYVADGGFTLLNPSHRSVVDESDLWASLVLRDYNGAAAREDTMPAGTAPDGFGNRSWPTSGTNANSLISYDPTTNVLTGVPGIYGSGDPTLSPNTLGNAKFSGWKLRWDADFNPLLSLAAGDVLPVQYCFESDQTGPVYPGDATNCFTHQSEVGAEFVSLGLDHENCPGEPLGGVPCVTETYPYAPGAEGETEVFFTNQTSLTGTGELTVQLPGKDGTKVATFTKAVAGESESSGLFGAHAAARGADSLEIWVSTGTADFSGPDVTARQVPSAMANWILCPTTGGGDLGVTCDAADLAVPAEDVTEVMVVVNGMRAHHISLNDYGNSAGRHNQWFLDIDWVLDDTVPSSMDGSVYDPTSTANEAFGTKSVFDFTPDDVTASPLSTFTTEVSEVTRESLMAHCGAYPGIGSINPATYGPPSAWCDLDAVFGQNVTAMDAIYVDWGLRNVGTIDNITGPMEFCLPVPTGLRPEGTAGVDPWQPRVFVSEYLGNVSFGTAYELADTDYSYTLSASVDPDIEGNLCVQVPVLTLPAGSSVHGVAEFLVLPGLDSIASFLEFPNLYGPIEAQGEDAAGNAVTLMDTIQPATLFFSGTAATDVNVAMDPSATIGLQSGTCYVHEFDTHAFDDSGTATLDPAGATLPTEDAVAYGWIPDDGSAAPPNSTGTTDASMAFWTSESVDTVATWVHTSNTPSRGDATTLAANGWQQCSIGGIPCDAAALAGIGVSAGSVRWVAFELGTLAISDIEPRGQAPFDGLPKINTPYTATVCIEDDGGSIDGQQAWMFTETHSSNLLTIYTEAPVLFLDEDCDNNQPTTSWPVSGTPINPGYLTTEVCDGLDNDCDGVVPLDEIDNDGDGFSECEGDCDDNDPTLFPGAPGQIDNDGDGFAVCDGDCDDNDPDTYPGAPELCDGLDNDCDGTVPADELDGDGDGITGCAGDCDDSDPYTYPGAPEICDGNDNDCDGDVPIDEIDDDGDGFAECGGDCDDTWGAVYPGAPELCDQVDNDCDGVVPADEIDDDGDLVPECVSDCDDTNPNVHGGWDQGYCRTCVTLLPHPELCDGLDNDCDGVIPADELDVDGDGVSICDGDCDDNDPYTYPGAPEICDGNDNDCDGDVPIDETDDDLDGASECEGDCDDTDGALNISDVDGDGFTTCKGDCDDDDPALSPDDLDLDGYSTCDGDCDDNDADLNLADIDGDGTTSCGGDCDDQDPALNIDDVDGDGYTTCDGDCDDNNPDLNLDDVDGDGFDSCKGDCDDDDPALTPLDNDNDGFSTCDGDCDDNDINVSPIDIDGDGWTLCDGDCDDKDPTLNLDDVDLDGFTTCDGDCDDSDPALTPADGDGDYYSTCDGDCDDTDPALDPSNADGDNASSCDGDCDDTDPVLNTADQDMDSYSTCDGDCDDSDPALNLDDVDGDGFSTCDGDCDDTDPTQLPTDADGDGFTLCNGDCDDTDPALNASDVDGDGVTTCDGDCDDSDPVLNTDDVDGDGFSTCDGDCDDGDPALNGDDVDGDGFSTCDGDCDDGDPTQNPADTDGDGTTSCGGDCDDLDGSLNVDDVDGDGFSTCDGDCDDGDSTQTPADIDGDGTSTCDGDCDDSDPSLNTDDTDGDGMTSCDGDCDDDDSDIYPGAYELCDDIDQDCDGDVADDFGVGEVCTVGEGACEATSYWTCTLDGLGVECDVDAYAPGSETCDGTDGDCDGYTDATEDDSGNVWSWCDDTDNDGLTDGTEHYDTGTDPNDPDTDGDGCQDGTELGLTEPEVAGATDTSVFVPDADPATTTDPLDSDSDSDGLMDCEEDTDGDGEVDDDETDPNNPDTDDGGTNDGDEIENGTDPLDPSDDIPGPDDSGLIIQPETERWVGGSCQGCQSGGAPAGAGWSLLVLGLLLRRRQTLSSETLSE